MLKKVIFLLYISFLLTSTALPSYEIRPGKWIFTFGNWTYDHSVIGFQSKNHLEMEPNITNFSVRYPTVGSGNVVKYALIEIDTNEGADIDCIITEGGIGKTFIQIKTLVKHYTKIHHQTTIMGIQPRSLTVD
ncbi:uncharacterized protein LOC129619149 [Condylostylus longicornis]|uniref:uncharacterized protein LOC129619149 n=1 Tax=Condylostylus longicornis TaxID=2530218 RepID=UPI00244DDECF|nr:uncharacterized protein LOC129619149 [Condylostylus longicornis]